MRDVKKRSLWVGALASILVVSGLSATAAPASAAGVKNLVVNQNAAGTITINQGSVLQAGSVVKAQFSSVFADADLEITQLAPGVTMTQVDQKIVEAGQGGATGAAAIRWFTGTNTVSAKATFYGGLPFAGANKFDRILAPGTYYVTQLRPSGNVKPSTVAKKFTVVGTPQAILPVVGSKVTVTNANSAGTDTFTASSTVGGIGVLHNGPVMLTNKTGSISSPRELHFFQFWPVSAGTTPQQACASVQPGGSGPSFGTLSTQQAVNAYLNVPLGWYWVTDWIPDGDSGTPHALECDGTLAEVVA